MTIFSTTLPPFSHAVLAFCELAATVTLLRTARGMVRDGCIDLSFALAFWEQDFTVTQDDNPVTFWLLFSFCLGASIFLVIAAIRSLLMP